MLKIFSEIAGASTVEKRLTTATVWLLAGTLFIKFLSILQYGVILKQIGPYGFGIFSLVITTCLTLHVFVTYGYGIWLTRTVSNFSKNSTQLSKIVIRSYICGGYILAASILLVFFLNICEFPELIMYLPHGYAASAAVATLCLTAMQMAILNGLQAYGKISLALLISGILSLPLYFIFPTTHGIQGSIFCITMSALFLFVINSIFINILEQVIVEPVLNKDAGGEIVVRKAEILPLFFSALVVAAVDWYTISVLLKNSNGVEQIAVLTIFLQWFSLQGFLPNASGKAIIPLATQSLNQKDIGQFLSIKKRTLLINIIFSLAVVLGAILFHQIIFSFYSIDLFVEFNSFVILLIAGMFIGTYKPAEITLICGGWAWESLIVHVFYGVVAFVCLMSLFPMGVIGIALAKLITLCIHSVVINVYVNRKVIRYAR